MARQGRCGPRRQAGSRSIAQPAPSPWPPPSPAPRGAMEAAAPAAEAAGADQADGRLRLRRLRRLGGQSRRAVPIHRRQRLPPAAEVRDDPDRHRPRRVERLSIYNQTVLPKNPLNGARVKNTTGKHLLQGPSPCSTSAATPATRGSTTSRRARNGCSATASTSRSRRRDQEPQRERDPDRQDRQRRAAPDDEGRLHAGIPRREQGRQRQDADHRAPAPRRAGSWSSPPRPTKRPNSSTASRARSRRARRAS